MPEAVGCWGCFARENNKQWISWDADPSLSAASMLAATRCWFFVCCRGSSSFLSVAFNLAACHTKMAQVAEAAAAETLCCAVCCAGCTGCCGGDCCRDCVEGCGLLSCCELLGCLACLSCCCPCCCQSQKQGPPPVVLAQGPAMYPPGCPGYTPEQMMMGPPVYAPQAQVMGYPQGAYR